MKTLIACSTLLWFPLAACGPAAASDAQGVPQESFLAQFIGAGFGDSPPNLASADLTIMSTVARTAAMVADPKAQYLAWKYHLVVLNVTWEDTARYFGSCVGPNISDATIQVEEQDEKTGAPRLTLMPVIRFPNFADVTCDLPPENFYLVVGNEKEERELERITLREYLSNPRQYMTDPASWKGSCNSLLAPRDTHVLVSAQACFLPVPKEGKAEFNPVIFNYQSSEKNPAVLVILATREGTSMTVIDNRRDPFEAGWTWGQRLFFNQQGERANLTGQRKSDFEALHPDAPDDEPSVSAGGEEGLNMVLLIQVPLKHKPLRAPAFGGMGGMGGGMGMGGGFFDPAALLESDVEEAVIGHGEVEGPFTEVAGLPIRRDPKYPVRVTVQFYKATGNGVVDESDLALIATQVNRVYKDSSYTGSLVLDGPQGRLTEYRGKKVEPPWWWKSFWKRHEENTGLSRYETVRQLRSRLGPGWYPRTRRQMIHHVRSLGPG